MLTSHAYHAPHDHFSQGGLYHQEGTDASKSQVEGATTKIMNPSPTCGDPFGESVHSGSSVGEGVGQAGGGNSPSQHFAAEDEFETMGINIPSSALEEQQQQAHQGGGYNNYQQQQQQQMMHHHQQHQQWQHHQQQMQQQQQQWHHQGQYMNPNGYGHAYEQYGYGDYGQMYAQGGGSGHPHSAPQGMNSSNGSVVGVGGPSPVASHNTPSPQGAHSDDGVLGGSTGEDSIRNNNILKRPSPGSVVPGVIGNGGNVPTGVNNMHPGVLHHGHQGIVHQMGHHHHHGTMATPYHLHGHPQHQIQPPGMPVAKKPKVSKRKKKRDPNEPNKPVSAYALFFRDSQASIKVANPNAAFGDVSKIVASLWDALDPDSKAAYKKRTENAKKEYLKKLAAYRASLVSKGGDSGIGYGYYGYSDVMQNSSIHPSHKYMGASGVTNVTAGGVGQSSPSYMGQPIPPRPPIQHGQPGAMSSSHMHHGHATSGAYMMQGQMQNGGMMGGQSPHSGHPHGAGGVHHSAMSQHSPMDNNSSHLHNQAGGSTSIGGGPIHSPAGGSTSSGSSSGQTPLNTPTSASISSSSPNGCVVSHVNKSSQQGTPSSGAGSSHGKQCGRPGCTNLVQRTPDGWAEEFCSNECVVGQCKEVYTNWSSGSNTSGNNGNGGPPTNPYSSPTAPPVK